MQDIDEPIFEPIISEVKDACYVPKDHYISPLPLELHVIKSSIFYLHFTSFTCLVLGAKFEVGPKGIDLFDARTRPW